MNVLEAAVGRLAARRDIPVFPLPNVVLFPHVSLGLHIFEPRYRRMVEDALASDRLIAMALLREGWERDYYGSPPVHPVACAGVIEEYHRLPDARLNIRLRGLSRIALGAFASAAPYRVAEFQVLSDRNADDGPAVQPYRERLLLTCAGLLREIGGARRARWRCLPICRSPWGSTPCVRDWPRTPDAARSTRRCGAAWAPSSRTRAPAACARVMLASAIDVRKTSEKMSFPSWKKMVFISSVCTSPPPRSVPVSWQRGCVPPPGSHPVARIEPSQLHTAECQLVTVGAVVAAGEVRICGQPSSECLEPVTASLPRLAYGLVGEHEGLAPVALEQGDRSEKAQHLADIRVAGRAADLVQRDRPGDPGLALLPMERLGEATNISEGHMV